MEPSQFAIGANISSEKTDWGTPRSFMEYIEKEFYWTPTLDAAASMRNTKAPKFYNKKTNGLIHDWGLERVWLNPPYSRNLPVWLEKCRATAEAWPRYNAKGTPNASIFCLIPARTDTKWFHEIVMPSASQIYFIKGRFQFDHPEGKSLKGSSAFPSMLVTWRQFMCASDWLHQYPAEMTTLEVPQECRGWN